MKTNTIAFDQDALTDETMQNEPWTTYHHIECPGHTAHLFTPIYLEVTTTLCGRAMHVPKVLYYHDQPLDCPDCLLIIQTVQGLKMRRGPVREDR